ncbi:tyrosine-type recombinase/integrase [Azohydromonas australica]|uniref:tyrosine-type recombinase/integrase n=1 Tax=Azohydromonas australica TaxID=364039 RepID=UPI0003FD4A2F|nr:tyrosine-type recombinase/integrase [Azohydromonas australica]
MAATAKLKTTEANLQQTSGLHAQHCPQEEYEALIEQFGLADHGYQRKVAARRFVSRWPDLMDWMKAPLARRASVRQTSVWQAPDARLSQKALGYLMYLGIRGYAKFDYPWLLVARPLFLPKLTWRLDVDLGIEQLKAEAVRLGFSRISVDVIVRWAVTRLALHTGVMDARHLTGDQLEEFRIAVQSFLHRSDVLDLVPCPPETFDKFKMEWPMRVNQLGLLLFHRGQIDAEPRKKMVSIKVREPTPPKMQAIVDRWLAVRRTTDRPDGPKHFDVALYRFMVWLGRNRPQIKTFTKVRRDDVLAYIEALAHQPTPRTGQPLAALGRRAHITALGQFFSNTAAWGWRGVPGFPLLGFGDCPRMPMRVPRFIPTDELARLMAAVAHLQCPYQRTALLIARWTGARKGEIQRLAVNDLDQYPDGTPRLRLPPGKTYKERIVPLHHEAADALKDLIARREVGAERPLRDQLTGVPTRYVFMDHGRLLSCAYLFQVALAIACREAGLLDAQGRPTISAHRFRHTVGTQLAERGAKLHTIMSVLGHSSASMSMIYARISDKEVLRDYQSVLSPGAVIAGPGADLLRSGALQKSAVHWLKCNFFKTELELGHCLRLPEEGPCECDLYLTCAKFVTTPAYVPRLKERLKLEKVLAKDAVDRGWPNEQRRHLAVAARIEQLLCDLDTGSTSRRGRRPRPDKP